MMILLINIGNNVSDIIYFILNFLGKLFSHGNQMVKEEQTSKLKNGVIYSNSE